MRRYLGILVGLSWLAVCSGCVTTTIGTGPGAGVGTYTYVSGELEAVYAVTIEEIWPRAMDAMHTLRLKVGEQTVDGLGGKIVAQRTDGTTVKVWLKPLGKSSTIVSVRVGFWGNRDDAARIHDMIRNQFAS